jgi:hypothetical protein
VKEPNVLSEVSLELANVGHGLPHEVLVMFKFDGLSRRAVAVVTATTFLFAAAPAPMAFAQALIPAQQAVSGAVVKAGEATDISARRRYARRGYRNNAAGLAFMGLALGTVGAVIANQQRRDYYRQNYYYGGDGYYGGRAYGQPGYYGGGPYYGY